MNTNEFYEKVIKLYSNAYTLDKELGREEDASIHYEIIEKLKEQKNNEVIIEKIKNALDKEYSYVIDLKNEIEDIISNKDNY